MILLIMMLNSFLFMLFSHPLCCGLTLLIQTILTTLFSGMMNYNFWYSYILFLIMIGGMLIIFIYMTSVASNEKFKFNNKLLMLIMLMILMILISMILDPYYYNWFFKLYDLNSLTNSVNPYYSLNKYFNLPNFIIMMMMIYLLFTLIAVVKITNFKYGALRQTL